ncbi:helix-turn-helix domain-containing protein [Metabacillus sediminilitoris]|uniref:Helix-turn-helix transcriptional regulator n=1 Tax=Metabacillus sediminilitoris TaxID=2567941 RepID=A0A4S4C0W3_9BACI|nr:helix-turn-helix transcriptional regulator [Metabacillus sediminilitoris]QGQ47252.1 helix-turn-helix domain-containing protein [Metabacillus sediminilitoris]THF80594.1 helix-turn-helix transcriptional regulator [Metabacillus sediminilitoris]
MNTELIRHLRSITNLSQADLAKRVGVHQTLISKIEAGVIELQPHTEQKILSVFGTEGISGQDIALLHSVFESRKMKTVKKDWSVVR